MCCWEEAGPRKFRGPASSQLYISGGVHRKIFFFAQITAKAFSYIRTAFGRVGQGAWVLGWS